MPSLLRSRRTSVEAARTRRTSSLGRLAVLALTAGLLVAAPASPAQAENRVTPGNFTGYGFDQCETQASWKMDRWMQESPFSAVGIYISGKSRACREQRLLTPDWVEHQLKKGWRLLPITLGPQASCLARFPRYHDDESIKPDPDNNYGKARRQGRREARDAVDAAGRLGIVPGSTLWYDLEGFTYSNDHCRESALRFLGAWTNILHNKGYVSGVYSSASSGIKMLDQVRMHRPGLITLPDRLWIARWDGRANLDACHNQAECWIQPDGWQPHSRVKQYRGGHDETWGGVTINIDSNYMSLGEGTVGRSKPTKCGGVTVDLPDYPPITAKRTDPELITAAQCLLRKKRVYDGPLDGLRSSRTLAAFHAWKKRMDERPRSRWTRKDWIQLLSAGGNNVAKFGMKKNRIRRLQRALNAALGAGLVADGAFLASTESAVKTWQGRVGLPRTGVMDDRSWQMLQSGRRK